jgi:hypothetical protein
LSTIFVAVIDGSKREKMITFFGLKKRKGILGNEDCLDHIGREELSAIDFGNGI